MEKPSVTICMAIYKPNEEWLEAQLRSLDNQIYDGEIDLLIWNDSPNEFDDYNVIVRTIKKIKWKILDNGKNNGLVKAFELLTSNAEGEYIAYCDQDDIWLPSKINRQIELLLLNNCVASCCRAQIMDGKGNVTDKLQKFSANINVKRNLQHMILTRNNILGCEMIVKTEIARDAIPFPEVTMHDVWLAMYATEYGGLYCSNEKLIYYRRHSYNNSSFLKGIYSPGDYKIKKILRTYKLIECVAKRLENEDDIRIEMQWAKIRCDYAEKQNKKNLLRLISVINIRPNIVVFELILPILGTHTFNCFIKVINKIKGYI